ncbi:scavenger receptor cysteine-rich domain-containing protein DMBT1-like [Littorina saxatilis]|uniref:scavenger receptor cysteine-rich domain-containing protein DMBT1-like n=1 Tax=Littorina saxatilis TaxID=31220 RepID=UPI0038B5BB5C
MVCLISNRVLLVSTMLLGISTAQQLMLDAIGANAALGIGLVMARPNNQAQWGYICDDAWNQGAATVVCNQLGFGANNIAEPGLRNDYMPVIAAPPNIALDDVSCVGNETNLWACIPDLANAWGVNNCNGNELAGVTCVNVPDPVPAAPAPILQCGNIDMVLLYVPPWTVVPDPVMTLLMQPNLNTLTIPYADINTAVVQNAGNIVYTRVIVIFIPSFVGSIDLFRTYNATLTCTLPQVGQVEATFQATGVVGLADQGAFNLAMNIYQDRTFVNAVVNYPYQLPMGDWMNMAVVLNAPDNRLKLVVTNCLAAPVPNIPIGQNNLFYNNRCLMQPTISATYPLNNNMFGFRIQSFAFLNAPQVVLQCDVIVCLATDGTAQCDRSCNSNKPVGRRRRDTMETSNANHTVYKVYSRLINISNVTSTGGETVSTATQKSTNIRVENGAMNPNQPSRLVMTLGNAASLPSVSVIHVFIPMVAVLYLCLLCTE